ncbi:M14 family metallopeptidase [Congregibacter litoralis]|uniref:Succinylglutamate desuccinylase n=1 Tax=Congregibacter litoralis KT71 TaxID=314285 RepID=A4AAC9_9GAMM|nr:M14 family metallopeptidase [Congregibacter litoralis]EAQ97006.1 Succinylglutamate desuccinylase [Congregibacter litoralis KT71]
MRFRFLKDPDKSLAGSDPNALLENLGGPACILFTGQEPGRTRALVTLLHGNEPSGLFALHRWLHAAQQPRVNLLFIVASVHAALAEPRFSHRMLPRARDLNRCFRPPYDDEQGRLAQEILELLRVHRPEAVVDMHNTSGSGPSFGVCTHLDRQHDALVSLFTRRLVVSNLNLGALMDISDASCPTVTVEVGGRLDDEAHALAYEGLQRYAFAKRVLAQDEETDWGIEIFRDPIRLELREGVTLAYAEALRPGFDITLRSDIEHLNFGEVPADTPLGWVKDEPQSLFRATDAQGRCAVASLVRCEDGALYPSQSLKLFMITTNAAIAESDCLFYAVATDDADPTPGQPLRNIQ